MSGDELCRLIVHQSPDAVIFANTKGIIELWNAAAESLFGFTAQEVLGRSLDVLVPERFRAAHWMGYERALGEGRTRYNRRPMTTRSLHKTRDPFYVDMAFEVVKDQAGRVIGAMATARDATEKMLAARPLKK